MRRERTKRPVPQADRTDVTPFGDRWAVRADTFVSPRRARGSAFRNVLAAVDGTPLGEHAVPLSAAVARRAGATLRLVHVFSTRELAGEAARVMADARWVFDLRRRRGEYLDGLVRRLERAHPLPVTGALLVGSDVSEAVCEASASADLIVMAARDRGSWARYWRGSVTAVVGRFARCPVLLAWGRDDAPNLGAARLPRDTKSGRCVTVRRGWPSGTQRPRQQPPVDR